MEILLIISLFWNLLLMVDCEVRLQLYDLWQKKRDLDACEACCDACEGCNKGKL